MASSALSRRMSEFLGVALFATALIWLISLASYSASDPVWFFNTGSDLPPANFAGRIGAFMGELSYRCRLLRVPDPVCGRHRLELILVRRWAAPTPSAGRRELSDASVVSSLAFGTLDVGQGVPGRRLAAPPRASRGVTERTGAIF